MSCFCSTSWWFFLPALSASNFGPNIFSKGFCSGISLGAFCLFVELHHEHLIHYALFFAGDFSTPLGASDA
jgi:hypothetical protein